MSDWKFRDDFYANTAVDWQRDSAWRCWECVVTIRVAYPLTHPDEGTSEVMGCESLYDIDAAEGIASRDSIEAEVKRRLFWGLVARGDSPAIIPRGGDAK